MQIRPSAMPIIMKCSAAATLPSVEEPKTDDLARGTSRHARATKGLAVQALAQAGFECLPETVLLETPLRVVEMQGTADVLAVSSAGSIVLDWKGPWDDFDQREQLECYAWMAEAKWCVVAHIDDDLKILRVESWEADPHWRDRFKARLAATPSYTTGDHCQRCTSFRVCPAQIGLVSGLVKLDGAITLDRAGEAWERIGQYEKAIEIMKDAIKDMARQHPIPLPNGKRLAVVEMPFESVIVEKALAVFPDLPVKQSITKDSLTQEQIVTLRKSGATKTKIQKQVREIK